MRRLCERPGCGAPAEVSYGIDNATLTVWVDNRAILEREHAGRLCRRHADALVVPRGWTLDDRRQAIPQLFRTSDTEQKASTPRTSTPRKPAKSRPDDGPSLFETIEAELAEQEASVHLSPSAPIDNGDDHDELSEPAPLEIDPDETKAIPWSPHLRGDVGEPSDEEETPVFGRLLGRAFGKKQQ